MTAQSETTRIWSHLCNFFEFRAAEHRKARAVATTDSEHDYYSGRVAEAEQCYDMVKHGDLVDILTVRSGDEPCTEEYIRLTAACASKKTSGAAERGMVHDIITNACGVVAAELLSPAASPDMRIVGSILITVAADYARHCGSPHRAMIQKSSDLLLERTRLEAKQIGAV